LLELSEFAQEAARLTGGRRAIGDYLRTIEEEPGLISYHFKSTLRGYVGWYWSVTIYQPEGVEPTISEVVMLPSEEALVAPKWIPWSERLADYKALQAELEAQAAAEAAELAEAEADTEAEDATDEDVAEDEIELVDAPEEETISHAEEVLLATTEFEVEDETEDDTDDAGKRPPRFYQRWKNRRKK